MATSASVDFNQSAAEIVKDALILIGGIEDPEISSFLEVAKTGLSEAEKKCGDHCAPDDLQRHAEEEIVLQSVQN